MEEQTPQTAQTVQGGKKNKFLVPAIILAVGILLLAFILVLMGMGPAPAPAPEIDIPDLTEPVQELTPGDTVEEIETDLNNLETELENFEAELEQDFGELNEMVEEL